MAKRKGIGKATRFEVFKRDKFTCQYCGRSAPDVVLNVDHIRPVADGGDNDILNLITSCFDCNSGKSSHPLADGAVMKQRKAQLDELQERREQLEMLMEWQRSLTDLQGQAVRGLADLWTGLVPPYVLTDRGMQNLRRWLGKFSYPEMAEAMRVSAGEYIELEPGSGRPTRESVGKAFDYIPRICTVRRAEVGKPYLRDLFYIRGIMRKRFSYVRYDALQLLETGVTAGIAVDDMRTLATTAKNWTEFAATLNVWMQDTGA